MIFECSQQRQVEIPDCKEENPADCRRTFHLHLPSILCEKRHERSLLSSIFHRLLLGNGEGDDNNAPAAIDGSSNTELPAKSIESIGTLPLVFAMHCYGCTANSVTTFVEHANHHNVVLVLPEGLQSSFNAKHCCGYALEKDIDDIGFLKYIQSSLSEEFSFVQSDYSYAVGWSNGGKYYSIFHVVRIP